MNLMHQYLRYGCLSILTAFRTYKVVSVVLETFAIFTNVWMFWTVTEVDTVKDAEVDMVVVRVLTDRKRETDWDF